MGVMVGELQCIVIDCPVPRELVEFYRGLLGGQVNRRDGRWLLDDGWSTLHTEGGTILCFQRVTGYQPPAWPDPHRPQQFHIDLAVGDLDKAETEVLELGARLLDSGDGKRSWRVYADPAGHPFCLVRH